MKSSFHFFSRAAFVPMVGFGLFLTVRLSWAAPEGLAVFLIFSPLSANSSHEQLSSRSPFQKLRLCLGAAL